MAYEREVHKQRLRTEIAQAKKETNFYIENVERKKVQARKEKKKKKDSHLVEKETEKDGPSERLWTFKQTEPEMDDDRGTAKKRKVPLGQNSRNKKKLKKSDSTNIKTDLTRRACDNKSFLKNIFSGGLQNSDTED